MNYRDPVTITADDYREAARLATERGDLYDARRWTYQADRLAELYECMNCGVTRGPAPAWEGCADELGRSCRPRTRGELVDCTAPGCTARLCYVPERPHPLTCADHDPDPAVWSVERHAWIRGEGRHVR
ncbi:MAG: hypothetical protein ABIV94_02620 [Acidimicrobiales bacterium]